MPPPWLLEVLPERVESLTPRNQGIIGRAEAPIGERKLAVQSDVYGLRGLEGARIAPNRRRIAACVAYIVTAQ
jgi:hypothetical protein